MASKKIVGGNQGLEPWKPAIRTTTVNEGVWDMIDPEKWSSPEGDTIYEADTDPANIPLPSDGETPGHYTRMRIQEARAVRKRSSLSQIHSRILETVDVRHHVIFEDCLNVREVLVALQTRFKKTEHGKEQEIRQKWTDLMTGSKSMPMEHWLDDCLTTYQRGKKLDLEFTAKTNAAHAFLLALPKGYQREIMIDRFNEDKDAGKTVRLEDLIRKYRIKYTDFIAQATKTISESAFVTLNGQPPEESKQRKDKTARMLRRRQDPERRNPIHRHPTTLVVSTQDQNVSNKLAESFIIDSGATIHVCKDFDRFYDYHEMNDNSIVKIGDTFTHAEGYGQVKIHATPVKGAEPVEITLRDIAYIPRFGCNVVSLDLIMENGYAWDSTNGLILRGEKPVCRVERHHRMFTLEYKEAIYQVHAAIARRSHRRPENQSSTEVWHQRMGHANFEAIRHLPDSA
ncbi:hypothetical protein V8E54_010683 [Elaphomyces granulatus]